MLVDLQSHEVHPHLFDRVSLRCRDGREKPGDVVESPNGVVGAEGFLVGPEVPDLLQLADDATLGLSQRFAEYRLPLFSHDGEEHLRIGPVRLPLAFCENVDAGFPHRPEPLGQLPFDEWLKASREQVEGFSNTVVV